jgi:hypothetical protein
MFFSDSCLVFMCFYSLLYFKSMLFLFMFVFPVDQANLFMSDILEPCHLKGRYHVFSISRQAQRMLIVNIC